MRQNGGLVAKGETILRKFEICDEESAAERAQNLLNDIEVLRSCNVVVEIFGHLVPPDDPASLG